MKTILVLTVILFSLSFESFGQIGPDKLDNYIRRRFIDNQGREVVEVVVEKPIVNTFKS